MVRRCLFYVLSVALLGGVMILFTGACAMGAPAAPSAPPVRLGPPITSIQVVGNQEVVTDHILSVVTSKVGEPLNEDQLKTDAEAIFEQGFFSGVDYRIADEADGVAVTFMVIENPIVEVLNFTGNTVYKEETLRNLCFTKPGMVFNRVFFRNDLQRIKDKYQQDGYVMVRFVDVKVEGGEVNVIILEPKIGEIIIQGNRKTRTEVIKRQLRFHEGDVFNATILRHSINRVQGLGFFEDVNVGFEPSDDPGLINLVVTVAEKRSGRIGFSVGYGTESGWLGGVSYDDPNWQGLGHNVSVGFELGDRQQYWITYAQPYMDHKVYAWRAGIYKRVWRDISYYEKDVYQFDYDEDRKGIYAGLGRKFAKDSKWSWFLNADWHNVDIDPVNVTWDEITPQQRRRMESGSTFALTGTITRNNMDPYSPFPKGDVEALNVEQGIAALGGDWNYTKYWLEFRWYVPLNFLIDYLETTLPAGISKENPPLFAMRVRGGSSMGDTLPWAEDYVIGGDTTLRGYKDSYYRGDEMFLGNFELRVPVQKSFSLVAFYDVGKAWDSTLGESFSLSDLGSSYGGGIRVRTPLGQLRLDVAKGDEETRFHFGFGEMF